MTNKEWSDAELEAAVEAYRRIANSPGQAKAVIRDEYLEGSLSGRSKGSFERRMSNISAVLDEHGASWIGGYKPLRNVGPNVAEKLVVMLDESGLLSRSGSSGDGTFLCPRCGGTRAAAVFYGYPSRETMELISERDDIVLGGCTVLEDIPREVCIRCGWPNQAQWTALNGPDYGEFAEFRRPLNEALKEFYETQNLNLLALSFDAYTAVGLDQAGTRANEAERAWMEDRRLPVDIASLRICLFFEQRRSHHAGNSLDRPYTRALLAALEQSFSDKLSGPGVALLDD